MLTLKNQKLDHALEFKINDNLLVERIVGRLVHPSSGRTYHRTFDPPKKNMTDDVTGEPLIQRSDDNEETLKKRLDTYHKQTSPIVGYYRNVGILGVIDASDTQSGVWAQIKKIFNRQ